MITLKKLKIIEAMSEETTAFTAEVHFNDKLVAFAENGGKGGCTNVRPPPSRDEKKYPSIWAAFDAAEAWATTQPDKSDAEIRKASGEVMNPVPKHRSIDSYIDELVSREDRRRQRARYINGNLRRASAISCILGYREEGGDMVLLRFPDTADGRKALGLTRPRLVDLGGLSPVAAVAKVDAAYPL